MPLYVYISSSPTSREELMTKYVTWKNPKLRCVSVVQLGGVFSGLGWLCWKRYRLFYSCKNFVDELQSSSVGGLRAPCIF